MKTLSQRLIEQADAYVWSELTVKSLLREAAALARRVEEAPVRSVIHQHIKGDEWEALAFQLDDFLPAMIGKRVRIVEE